MFSYSIEQIEEKSNQIAHVDGGSRPRDARRGAADEQALQPRLDGEGDEHGERGALCPPHRRETGGERIDGGERGGGNGQQAHEAHEHRGVLCIQRGIERLDDHGRERKQPRRTGQRERERHA